MKAVFCSEPTKKKVFFEIKRGDVYPPYYLRPLALEDCRLKPNSLENFQFYAKIDMENVHITRKLFRVQIINCVLFYIWKK